MKRNIQFIICLLAFVGLNSFQAKAQSRSYEGSIAVNPVRLEQQGDSLYIDMDIVLDGVKVKSTREVNLIPQLVSSGQTRTLPEVTMKGKDEYKVYERTLSLMNAEVRAAYKQPYTVEKVSKATDKTIRYRYITWI